MKFCRFITSTVLSFAVIGFAGGAWSQITPRTTLVAVVPDTTGVQPKFGNAFAIADSKGGCTFVTAGHLVENTKILSTRADAASSILKRQFPYANHGLDVALSLSEDATHFGGCPGVPSRNEADELLSLDILKLTWYTEGFDLVSIPVYVKSRNDAASTVTIKVLNPSDQIANGMSGSPLLASGRPVGVLLAVSGQEAIVLRLDKLPADYRDMLSAVASNPKAPKIYEAYAIEQLPESVVKIVSAARDARTYVENSAVAARAAEGKAQTASETAKSLSIGQASGGYMQFKAKNLNDYSGMVNQKSNLFGTITSTTAAGYGITIVGSGSTINDQYLCSFDAEGYCDGQGVIRFATNEGNTNHFKEWVGGITKSSRKGYGILIFQDGETWYDNFQTDSKGNIISEPGVVEFPDGRRFEGIVGNHIEKGVMWKADGTILCVGIWTDGKVDPVLTKSSGLLGCPG